MRRILILGALVAVSMCAGCQTTGACRNCNNTCNNCPPANARPARVGQVPRQEAREPVGPQMATYAYPYYTTRGPRDFLQSNPPTIGR